MRRAEVLAHPPSPLGTSLNLNWHVTKGQWEQTEDGCGENEHNTSPPLQNVRRADKSHASPTEQGQLCRGEQVGTWHSLVNVWVRMLRNGTGPDAEFVREINCWGDFNRQLWWAVVNIQNTSVLSQRASWDTLLLLSHPHPSEPKEVYQYLDALEVGKFELHVPVSGDLKENKKQGVKHHNSELSPCSYSTERGTQWPGRYPEGWELLEHNCLPKLHRH